MLIRWNKKGRWVQNFLLQLQEFESFHSDLPRARWLNLVSVCVWSVCKWLSQWWLVFVLLGVDATPSAGGPSCTVSWEWNVSRVTPRLYGWVHKTLRLSPLVVEYSVVVMSYGYVLWLWVLDWILWVANFWFTFYETCVQNQWGNRILRPSWKLRHWWAKFNYRLKMKYLLAFNTYIGNFNWKTDKGKAQSIIS